MSEHNESNNVEAKDMHSCLDKDVDESVLDAATTSTEALSDTPEKSCPEVCNVKSKTEIGNTKASKENNALEILMREYRDAGDEYPSEDSSAESTVSGIELEDILEGLDDNDEKADVDDKSGPKTKGELSYEELPPVEELNITVEKELCRPVGTFLHSINSMAVVRGHLNVPPLNIDTVLFLEEGKRPFGKIFDVFGPIHQPYYTVRFNKDDDLTKLNIGPDEIVYCAPQMEYTSYINTAQLIREKGSDASWMDNNEPPPSHIDYSDDEEEAKARRKKKVGGNLGQEEIYETEFVTKMNSKNLALTAKRMRQLREGNWSMFQKDQYKLDKNIYDRSNQRSSVRDKCRSVFIDEMSNSFYDEEPNDMFADFFHPLPDNPQSEGSSLSRSQPRVPRLLSCFRPAVATPPLMPRGVVSTDTGLISHHPLLTSNRMPTAYVTPPCPVPRYAFVPITQQYAPSRLNHMIVEGVYRPTFPPPAPASFYQLVNPRFNPTLQSSQPIRTGYYLPNPGLMSALPPPPVTHVPTSTCPTSSEIYGGYSIYPPPDSTTDNF